MRLWLVSLDYSLPTLQAYRAARGDKSVDAADAEVTAELLERCVRTSQVLVAFALHIGGRPSRQ